MVLLGGQADVLCASLCWNTPTLSVAAAAGRQAGLPLIARGGVSEPIPPLAIPTQLPHTQRAPERLPDCLWRTSS